VAEPGPQPAHGTPGRPDRLLLVTWSPRLPAGLLSWAGWQALRSGPVYAADVDSAQADAVRAAGIEIHHIAGPPAAPPHPSAVPAATADAGLAGDAGSAGEARPGTPRGPAGASPTQASPTQRPQAPAADASDQARRFRDLARSGRTVVWLAGADGDAAFARALGDLVAREPVGTAELEVVYASWDPPGARLLDAVAVMDRLRSPGGCPWDAEQTHASLAPYLLEEAYELLDAIESGDLRLLREELGDVLLQVVFHARLAEDLPADERWSVDDVAGDLVAKLIRRHPHVFADQAVSGASGVQAIWDGVKATEKPRSSATDGVALGQPALSLAAKLIGRADKAGLAVDPPAGDGIGPRLFALVRQARAAGVDPEHELRAVAREFRAAVLDAERQAGADSDDTGTG
jgi:XTP/dITP diphosphohydrolase